MRRFLLLVVAVPVVGLGSCRSGPQEAPAPVPRPADDAPSESQPPEPAAEPAFEKAGELHYVEILTGGASAGDRLPMIVAIHGLGDDPRNFAGLVSDLDRPARIILPRAIDAWEGGGWSWFPVRAGDADPEGLGRGIKAAAEVIADGVTILREQRPTLGKPIVTGFSQGGMLSFALAVEHGELFSAAFPVGGTLPPSLWPDAISDASRRPPIVALHGDADPAVELGPTQEAVGRLEKLGLDVQLHVYPGVGHAISPQMRRELHQLLLDARTTTAE